MNNNISYGPHLFPGRLEGYIRKDNTKTTIMETHKKIIQTLMAGFDYQNPDSITMQLSEKMGFDPETKIELSFMNYGNTELVYLASIGDKIKVATLINQPHTPLGKVQEEFINLQRLREIDPTHVINPLVYFKKEDKQHEIYAAEYIDNALCIAHNNGHGIYNPLPKYHFENFSPNISREININMIALLVNYYDQEKNRGLAETETSGNDFMLTRDFKHNDPKTIQENIRLIAARKTIEASLDKYLDRVRKEFMVATRRYQRHSLQVNTRSEDAMTKEEIRQGIELGLQLRQQQKKQ